MAQDSELARIFFQSMKDREDLPEADQIRFDPLILRIPAIVITQIG